MEPPLGEEAVKRGITDRLGPLLRAHAMGQKVAILRRAAGGKRNPGRSSFKCTNELLLFPTLNRDGVIWKERASFYFVKKKKTFYIFDTHKKTTCCELIKTNYSLLAS